MAQNSYGSAAWLGSSAQSRIPVQGRTSGLLAAAAGSADGNPGARLMTESNAMD